MSPTKKILFAASVLFSAEFLCLPFLTYGIFSSTVQRIPSLLKTASHSNASTVNLDSPSKIDRRFVLEVSGQLTPVADGFLSARANAQYPFRRSIAVPHRFRTTLAPKVSRYIAKSVLNI